MRIVSWITPLLVLAALAPSSADAALLGAAGNTTFRVDAASGGLAVVADPAGALLPVPEIGALATDQANGAVWGIDYAGYPNSPVQLATFDDKGRITSRKTFTYLGLPVELAEGLAFGPNGLLWVTFHGEGDLGFQSGYLGIVDPASGAIQADSVVRLSNGSQDDGDMIEFIGGTLYLADNTFSVGTWLFTVDRATGVQREVGRVLDGGTQLQLTDLAWDGRHLYAESFAGLRDADSGRLVEIDPNTASARVIGPAGGREILDGITVAGTVPEGRGGGGHGHHGRGGHDCRDSDDRGHRNHDDPQPCRGND
jgi:hypothetical protein